MKIKSILDGLKQQAKTSIGLRFVAGNQSADMDSVVSAIAYAYFYHTKNPDKPPFLPLVNINRDELKLRKDIVMLLNRHSISSASLFFLDDLDHLVRGSSETVELALVDHCNIQGELLWDLHRQKRLNVTAIIDHHADEGVFKDASPRIIQSNGSCSALVFNYWNSQIDGDVDAETADLLLGPLLIDTSNMTQKVESEDVAAFDQYKKVLSQSQLSNAMMVEPSHFDTLYTNMKTAKKDLTGFSIFDILRKDYKQFRFETRFGGSVSIGFSSISKPISWILTKFSAQDVLDAFQQMNQTFHLDVIAITSSYTRKDTKTYAREFCYATDEPSLENLADHASALKLDDDIYNSESMASTLAAVNAQKLFRVYNQRNTQASRKQVVPVVKEIIEQL